MKRNTHIEIVRSTTTSLSSMGLQSCNMIQSVLQKHYTHVGVTNVSTIEDMQTLVSKQPDLVFLGMKAIPNSTGLGHEDKIWLSEYLDDSSINYTGSNGGAIRLDFDKPSSKRTVQAVGLPTASHFAAQTGQYKSTQQLPLPYPLFVKPPNTGGGKGIGADSVVRNFNEFNFKVAAIAAEYGTQSLVESYLPGREFSVAIFADTANDEMTVMPVELITERNARGDRILGQTVKATDTEHIVAVHDPAIKRLVIDLGKDIFEALGARDYGRIDIRLDENGIPHFLEANLVPGLAQHNFTSYFTSACWINERMDYETMILRLVEIGLSRQAEALLPIPVSIPSQVMLNAGWLPA